MNNNDFTGNSRVAIDILGNEWHYDCMGCSIFRGDITPPGGIIYEGKYTILAADPEVAIPGFLIVNIKRHVRSFSELTREERIEAGDLISHAEKAIKSLGIGNEVTLVQEERSRHIHIWVFPCYDWMKEKFGKGVAPIMDIMQYVVDNNNEDNVNEVLSVVEKVKKYFKEHDITE